MEALDATLESSFSTETGASAAGASAGSLADAQGLGRDSFMKLLVAQLQNQDPLEPLQNEAFVAQLAQFSSLEELTSINANLKFNQALLGSLNNSQAVGLIGKSALVGGSSFSLFGEGGSSLTYTMDGEAVEAIMEIKDHSGATVRRVDLGELSAGGHTYLFDGLDDAGVPLPIGDYTFSVVGRGPGGETVGSSTSSRITIEAVTFEDGDVLLRSGSRTYFLSDIIEVSL